MRWIMTLMFLGVLAANVYAGNPDKRVVFNTRIMPSVFHSSMTCAGGFEVPMSTFQSYFSHVNVSSPGSANSRLRLWNASTSSDTSHALVYEIDNVPTDAVADWWFNTPLSSGLVTSTVQGEDNTPADVAPCLTYYYGWK